MVLALGFADAEDRREPDFTPQVCETSAIDEGGAHAVETAFVELRVFAVEVFGNEESEDRIAEEFEALVIAVGRVKAGVREGLFQEEGVLEGVGKARLKGFDRVGHG
jgi:hypothetical protein